MKKYLKVLLKDLYNASLAGFAMLGGGVLLATWLIYVEEKTGLPPSAVILFTGFLIGFLFLVFHSLREWHRSIKERAGHEN